MCPGRRRQSRSRAGLRRGGRSIPRTRPTRSHTADSPEQASHPVEPLGEKPASDLAGPSAETDKQLEELHALLEIPAEEIAAFLDEQAEQAEKVLPRVMSFVVTPEQEQVIEAAVEAASDGPPGRDRRARGLANL